MDSRDSRVFNAYISKLLRQNFSKHVIIAVTLDNLDIKCYIKRRTLL